jgi:hypothetical protein
VLCHGWWWQPSLWFSGALHRLIMSVCTSCECPRCHVVVFPLRSTFSLHRVDDAPYIQRDIILDNYSCATICHIRVSLHRRLLWCVYSLFSFSFSLSLAYLPTTPAFGPITTGVRARCWACGFAERRYNPGATSVSKDWGNVARRYVGSCLSLQGRWRGAHTRI